MRVIEIGYHSAVMLQRVGSKELWSPYQPLELYRVSIIILLNFWVCACAGATVVAAVDFGMSQ